MRLDNVDKLEFLKDEIHFAENQLQPTDTGHISTAISWMRSRLATVREELKNGNVACIN